MGQSQGSVAHQRAADFAEGFSVRAEESVVVSPKVSSTSTAASSPRNLRHTLQMQHQRTVEQQQRQSRSKSLEPRAAMEFRAIEHRKSARYGEVMKPEKSRCRELWNPEKAAAHVIGQQLQNPHAQQQPLMELELGLFRMKQFRRKQSGQQQNIELLEHTKKDAITGLSAHQILILQKIWERSPESEISDCARNIMSHLLRSNAQMYQFFGLLGLSDREILNSSTFLRQSANFAIVLDFVLANLLDEVQKVCLALQCLGSQHAKLPWPIESHHWALFTRCFEDNPPKEVFLNAEGHDLWKIMINFIVIQMQIGYDRAIESTTEPVDITTPNAIPSTKLAASRRPSEGKKESTRQRYNKAMRSNTMVATEMDL